MRCLERFLTSRGIQALLDLCIGPEPDSQEKGQEERTAASVLVAGGKSQENPPPPKASKRQIW
jgi:hypothetical protein